MEQVTCKKCKREKPDDGLLRCEACRNYRKALYYKYKDKENEESRKYHAKNREAINARHTAYNHDPANREQIRENRYKRYHAKLKHDKRFMMDGAFSKAIRKELKRRNLRKPKPWEALLGYTAEQLMAHLEALFKPGMTWENYGSHWHIDHIRPKSWFVYETVEDEAFRKCWALENLQPLEALENSAKGNRYEG